VVAGLRPVAKFGNPSARNGYFEHHPRKVRLWLSDETTYLCGTYSYALLLCFYLSSASFAGLPLSFKTEGTMQFAYIVPCGTDPSTALATVALNQTIGVPPFRFASSVVANVKLLLNVSFLVTALTSLATPQRMYFE